MGKRMQTLRIVLFLLLLAAGANAQNVNRLIVPDVTGAEGSTMTLPINMDNTNIDIAAIQFDLSVPGNVLTLNTSEVVLTERCVDHAVVASPQGNGLYKVIVYSPTNTPFKANSGEIFGISATVAGDVDESQVFPLELSNVVISDVEGNNVMSGSDNGTFRISPSADFTITNITPQAHSAMPDETIGISWQVNNIGNKASTGGWSERLSLVSADGTEVHLGTFHNDTQTLAAGESMSRNVDVALASLLGIDGGVNIKVTVVPNSDSGEDVSYQKNNTAITADNPVNIGKKLYLALPASVEEGSNSVFRCSLSRSGSWQEAQTFSLAKTSGDGRLLVPETVTIEKGQSSAYFYLNVSNNDILDDDSLFTICASGNGYETVDEMIAVEDDEYPQITLTSSKSEITEGESFQLTITTQRASAETVTVDLTAEYPKRFRYPSKVTIPPGETSATVDVTAIDNDELELQTSVAFKAVAEKHVSGECIILLNDNDLPVIEMELSPASVSESSGMSAILAKIRRTTNTDKKTTIILSDDSDGDIYYPSTEVVMDANETEAVFSLGVVDNADAEGDRTVNITAAVYVSSCDCAATGTNVGVVSKAIEIIDDDGPALSITSSNSTILEGNEDGVTLTVKRNTNTDNALTVTISSDHDEDLAYEHSVTIPAGEASANVNVKAPSNDASEGDRTVVFTVEADNYAKGTCWLMLTDQTLPDATIASISLSASEVKVGENIDVEVSISNIGVADLPELTQIGIYVGDDATPVSTIYLQQALAAGGQLSVGKTITMPDKVGAHNVYAVANDGRKVKELLYVNNTSEKLSVNIMPPFSTSVSTDKAVYQQGETVAISGRIDGGTVADKDVEIYVINQGYRHVINASTNSQGEFTTSFQPYTGQIGHFSVGACYPGEKSTKEMAAFDIYGLKLASSTAITCQTIVGETYNGSLQVSNPGTLQQTGVSVTVVSKPADCNVEVSCPNTIAAGSNIDVNYAITGTAASTGNEWEQIQLLFETNEGSSLTATLYYYCRNASGKLKAGVSSINTTMVKGSTRDYPLVITNVGNGETGKITLALPSWMKSVTPNEMASLAYGDSATIVLRFVPTDEMQLNVPITGRIGINCENGEGLPLNYTIEPVSEATGTLIIDVCDEYTYYTAEAPHVGGAEVLVKHPTTGAVIAQGLTDDNGLFTVSLPEGYYSLSVTADNHDTYRNNIIVDPGKETKKIINLSFQAITIDWNVEETEIEDEYTIETTVKFETNVPMPVVVMSGPQKIDGESMAVGESILLHYSLTNKGLVEAQDVEIFVPEKNSEWSFTILDNAGPFNLSAQQSVIVPILVTKLSNGDASLANKPKFATSSMAAYINSCMAGMAYNYKWRCGTDLKDNPAAFRLALKACTYGAIVDAILQSLSFLGGGGPGGGPVGTPGYYGDTEDIPLIDSEMTICDPDVAACAESAIDGMARLIPFFGNLHSAASTGLQFADDYARNNRVTNGMIGDVGLFLTPPAIEIAEGATFGRQVGIGTIVGHAISINSVRSACGAITSQRLSLAKKQSKSSNSWMDEFNIQALRYYDQLIAVDNAFYEIFGDRIWYDYFDESKQSFFKYLSTINIDEKLNVDMVRDYKPETVSFEQLEKLVERINNSYVGSIATNKIDFENLLTQINIINDLENEAINEGYESLSALFEAAYENLLDDIDEASSNICSSITLKLTQTMTMTRQAFRGTLTVFNGNEDKAMEDVRLNLEVRDEDGVLATSHEFQINAESLDGFTGELDLSSGWSLSANETGVATILFIPTKYAALETNKDYSFGGSLTYVDPFTDLEITRDLYPVTLTVKPSPELDLTYFMQRDVYGDDALTADIVEPSVPAEFALIINNKGYGDANNVRMVTNQPEIVENEKGLLIDFELISAQLNGKESTLALGGSVATDFGTIPAHSQVYAQWWLQSSLLGHFTDYDVKATHVTSYGNEDLSLLDDVTIHELIRGFTVDDKQETAVRGFLVNDITDAEDTPDMLYFTDCRTEESVAVSSANMLRVSDTEYAVTVVPSAPGWNYGSANDLTSGRQKLVSVVRQSDGAELPADNFWLTDRTLRDGKDPLYEYKLHYAVNVSSEETYLLTFEPKPSVELSVESFEGVPEEGTVLTSSLETVSVKFNKAVDPSTFTTADISLNCQGGKVDISSATISKVSDSEFNISLDGLTTQSGYYVLTVQTTDITDNEGYTGSTGQSISWIQHVDGKVALTLTASPEEGGTVSPASGRVDYGSEITVKAIPAEGYEFGGWFNGDELVTDEPSFDYTATDDADFTALFTLKHFNVNIIYDAAQGVVENVSSGIYGYGTVLDMKAVPYEGYDFIEWLDGTETLSKNVSYSHVVKENIDITAKFAESIGTDIADLNAKPQTGLIVSPIPLRDIMYVSGNFNNIELLTVADISGSVRIVKAGMAKDTGVDVSMLPEGIYIIRVVTDNGAYSRKVYKKR